MRQPKKQKPNFKEFFSNAIEKFADSIGDMIVTVAVTGMTMAYMSIIIHPVYADTIPGLYLAAMITQLFIRIVHRFDESYTTDEVGKQLVNFEDRMNARFDDFYNHFIP